MGIKQIAPKRNTSMPLQHIGTSEEHHPEKVNGWCVIIEAIRASNRWPAGMQFTIFIVSIIAVVVCVWKIGVVEAAAGSAAVKAGRQVVSKMTKK